LVIATQLVPSLSNEVILTHVTRDGPDFPVMSILCRGWPLPFLKCTATVDAQGNWEMWSRSSDVLYFSLWTCLADLVVVSVLCSCAFLAIRQILRRPKVQFRLSSFMLVVMIASVCVAIVAKRLRQHQQEVEAIASCKPPASRVVETVWTAQGQFVRCNVPGSSFFEKLTYVEGIELPGENITTVTSLTGLRWFYIRPFDTVSASDLIGVAAGGDLEVLHMPYVRIAGEFSFSHDFHSLRGLNARSTDVIGDGIEQLTLLEVLDLSGNDLKYFEFLDQLPRLKYLALNDVHVSDKELAVLRKLRQLEVLELNMTDITDSGITHLASLPLWRLCLSETRISDTSVPDLCRLSNLRELNIAFTQISQAGVCRLRNRLLNCAIAY
jgi:hypothetical protein